MSLLGLVVTPPAMLVLRKLVKRIRARLQPVHGTADILETMQESLQGHPHGQGVHARRGRCANASTNISSAVERDANKMARVSNRSSPLMEMLGGFAVPAA